MDHGCTMVNCRLLQMCTRIWAFFFLSAQLCFAFSCKDLASRAKNALLTGMQKLRMFHNNSFVLLIKLFDSQIQPIIQYGAEIWK